MARLPLALLAAARKVEYVLKNLILLGKRHNVPGIPSAVVYLSLFVIIASFSRARTYVRTYIGFLSNIDIYDFSAWRFK